MAEQALNSHWRRLPDTDAREAYGARLGALLDVAILESVDWDLRPPSPAQVAFAQVISRKLGVAVPPDALRYRGAMGFFLDSNSDAFKRATSGQK
jgi:hypothetical protein